MNNQEQEVKTLWCLQFPNKKLAGYHSQSGLFWEAKSLDEVHFDTLENLASIVVGRNYHQLNYHPFNKSNNYFQVPEVQVIEDSEPSDDKSSFNFVVNLKIKAGSMEEAKSNLTNWLKKIDDGKVEMPVGCQDVVEKTQQYSGIDPESYFDTHDHVNYGRFIW